MTRGLVGVIANDSARYSLFASCIDQLILPDGWKKQWVIGGDWCDARNQLCQMVLDEGYSHLWFMDDDHAFPPEILTRLLSHDVPLVTPVCLTRVYPFNPVQYVAGEDGGKTLPIPLSRVATDGLIEVQAAGCAGMLISREVLLETSWPWREMARNRPKSGLKRNWFEYTDQSEDVLFCEKARAAGFTLSTDLAVRLGHITTAVVWPAVEDGRWVTGLNIGRDLKVNVDTFEGFLEKEKPWLWELRHERGAQAGHVVIDLERAPNEPVNWQPSDRIIRKHDEVLQWWCDMNDGNGFVPVGDPFTYTLEEAT